MKKNKQRYILFTLITGKTEIIELEEIQKTLWQSIWRFFGIKIANRIGLWIIEYDKIKKRGIIRFFDGSQIHIMITALTMIKTINNKKVIINPIKTSGTIKAIKKLLRE